MTNGLLKLSTRELDIRGGSRTAATSKMERFVIIVNGFPPLTIITEHSILVGAAALDPPLVIFTIGLRCVQAISE